MKTIGQLLRHAREKDHLSIEALAEITKIRPDYIVSIEQDQFDKLPSATFVKGFIRNLALALQLDPQVALAVFRRDFDQNKQGKIIPRGLTQPISTPSPLYNPRTTTIIITLVIFLLIIGYIFKQILDFNQAPPINLNHPERTKSPLR